jgi:cbb3-type cytochrome oxidase cytochrome c subunit
MIVLILLVVAVGGMVEIVPLFFQRSTTATRRRPEALHRAAAGRARHLHP